MKPFSCKFSRFSIFIPQVAAALFGVFYFFYLGLGQALFPTHLGWTMEGDYGANVVGWIGLRHSKWGLPLGKIDTLLYPHGSTVGYTDGLPWIGVFFKLIEKFLPDRFQYLGLWWCASYMLMGVVGATFVAKLTPSKWAQTLAGILCVLCPILPERGGHIALCGLWLIALCVTLNVGVNVDDPSDQTSRLYKVLSLLFFACGIHPYLATMILVLALGVSLKGAFSNAFSTRRKMINVVAPCLVAAFTFWLFGYVGGPQVTMQSWGFGYYSTDLSSLFNPLGKSRFFSGWDVAGGQYEGFGYLGAGVLFLLGVHCLFFLFSSSARRNVLSVLWKQTGLICGALFCFGFALSSKVTWLGKPVFDLSRYYAPILTLADIFRSSGRFIWPLHILLLLGALSIVLYIKKKWVAEWIFFFAICIQFFEPTPLAHKLAGKNETALPTFPLKNARRDYKHIALVPIQFENGCPIPYSRTLIFALAYEGFLSHMTLNSGHFSRYPQSEMTRCRGRFDSSELDAETLYIVEDGYLSDFKNLPVVCGLLHEKKACVVRGRNTAMEVFLTRHSVAF